MTLQPAYNYRATVSRARSGLSPCRCYRGLADHQTGETMIPRRRDQARAVISTLRDISEMAVPALARAWKAADPGAWDNEIKTRDWGAED